MNRPARILVVDDHPLVLRGLVSLLSMEPDLVVCGECGQGEAALAALDTEAPDLVITDLEMRRGGTAGIDLVQALRRKRADVPILVCTLHDERAYVDRAFAHGASGFVTKQDAAESLLDAVRAVLAGGTYVSPRLQ